MIIFQNKYSSKVIHQIHILIYQKECVDFNYSFFQFFFNFFSIKRPVLLNDLFENIQNVPIKSPVRSQIDALILLNVLFLLNNLYLLNDLILQQKTIKLIVLFIHFAKYFYISTSVFTFTSSHLHR